MLGLQTLLLQGTSVSGPLPPELGSLPFLTTVNVRLAAHSFLVFCLFGVRPRMRRLAHTHTRSRNKKKRHPKKNPTQIANTLMSCCGSVGQPLSEAAPPLPDYLAADADRRVAPTLTNQNLLVLGRDGFERLEFVTDLGSNML